MRAGAELVELTLAIERNFFALAGVLFDKLDLKGFVLLLHELDGFVRVKLVFLKGQSLLDYLFISASIFSSTSGVKGTSTSKS